MAIRVDSQVCHWHEGKVLIFDDAYEHEAWNHTDKTRVVLFVDFVKPLKFPARFINWCLMNLAIFTPFIKEGLDNHNEWEKKFYAEAESFATSRKPEAVLAFPVISGATGVKNFAFGANNR